MKVFVVLGLLFAFTQANSDLLKKAAETVPQCATEKGLDLQKIVTILKESPLPTDNEEFTTFFTCYYTKLGLLKDDGEVDLDKIRGVFPAMIKQNLGDDIDSDRLAKDAIDHCEEVSKGSSGTITAIKIRNCGLKYVHEHHHDYHH